MKKTAFASISMALALTSFAVAGPDDSKSIATPPAPAPAPSDAGFYIGTDAGVFLLQNQNVDLGRLPLSADVHYKTGWGIDVPLGYNFGNGLSVGISAGYYSADVNSVTLTPNAGYGFRNFGPHRGRAANYSFRSNGEEETVPLFAEASYSVHLVGALSWNIGAGVGAAYTRNTSNFLYDDEWDFAFEATTGFSYKVAPNAAINLGYRYLNINQIGADHLNGHAIELGFKFNF